MHARKGRGEANSRIGVSFDERRPFFFGFFFGMGGGGLRWMMTTAHLTLCLASQNINRGQDATPMMKRVLYDFLNFCKLSKASIDTYLM